MTEELQADTEHNRSFRTDNGYLAAFRYLAFDGRRFGTLDYHLGKLADRSLSVIGALPKRPPWNQRNSLAPRLAPRRPARRPQDPSDLVGATGFEPVTPRL
jgi:hypothetical protein